jgi:regulator of chromosome condensation (RCC1) repeat-containing protein/Regulator of Chromosome Condensation (RCC1) repeat protein
MSRHVLTAVTVTLALAIGASPVEARLKAVAVTTGGPTCALLSNATVKCWGAKGKLTAVAVPGLAGVTGVSSYAGSSCASLGDGTVRCWGENGSGQLGDGTTTDRSLPVAVQGLTGVVSVSAGPTACALLADHAVKCWGENTLGTLGNGTYVGSSTPVAVPGLNDITAVSVRDSKACALHANGTVSCWGWSGHLGPVEDMGNVLTPTLVPNLDSAVSVEAEPFTSCAVTTQAVAACWDSFGAPKVVRGFTKVKQFSWSPDGQQTEHACAVIAGGTVKCQSPYAYLGQIGDGFNQTKKVITVPGLHGAIGISASSFYTCAVLRSGGVKCWGDNAAGQLGDGTKQTRFHPVSVRGIDQPASGKADLDVFAGRWFGHERSLTISRKGRAKMVVYLGCCSHIINLWFQLSHIRGTYSVARARARVTRVHVFNRHIAGDGPRVGRVGTLRLNHGYMVEPFSGWNFCDEVRGGKGDCGA